MIVIIDRYIDDCDDELACTKEDGKLPNIQYKKNYKDSVKYFDILSEMHKKKSFDWLDNIICFNIKNNESFESCSDDIIKLGNGTIYDHKNNISGIRDFYHNHKDGDDDADYICLHKECYNIMQHETKYSKEDIITHINNYTILVEDKRNNQDYLPFIGVDQSWIYEYFTSYQCKKNLYMIVDPKIDTQNYVRIKMMIYKIISTNYFTK